MSLSTIRVRDVLRIADEVMDENTIIASWLNYAAIPGTNPDRLIVNQVVLGDSTFASIYYCKHEHSFDIDCNECKNVTVTFEDGKGITSVSVNKRLTDNMNLLMDKTLAEILN